MIRLIVLPVLTCCICIVISCSPEPNTLEHIIEKDIISVNVESRLIYSDESYFDGDYTKTGVYLIDKSSHSDLVIDFFEKYQTQLDSSWSYSDEFVRYYSDKKNTVHYELEYIRGSRILVVKEIKI